jgi:uncharacterized protein involved in response to NO
MGCTMIVRRVPDRALSERINQMPFVLIAIIAVLVAGRIIGLTPAHLRTSGVVGILYFALSARVKETLSG